MPRYELVQAAEKDLESIAAYTLSKWGERQALLYGDTLQSHFDAIGDGTATTRIFLRDRPELRMSRIEHHYVFHLDRGKQCPLIIAVLHENMDLMRRLRSRLAP